jgi:hypothetical protein
MKPTKKKKQKNREPNKSTGRYGELRNSKQDKHLERKRKEKTNFMFRNNGVETPS